MSGTPTGCSGACAATANFHTASPHFTSGLGNIDADGHVVELFTDSVTFPIGLASGPDGNVWFTDVGHVGRMSVDGTVTEVPSPGRLSRAIVPP